MKNYSDLPTQVCQLTQLAARAAIDDLTSVPELNDLRPYHELCEALCLAARAAGDLARWLGDKETADHAGKAITQLCELVNL